MSAARARGVWERVSLRAACEWLLLAFALPALVQLLLVRLVHLSSHECRRDLLREPPDEHIGDTTRSAPEVARERSTWLRSALVGALEWLPLEGRSLAS